MVNPETLPWWVGWCLAGSGLLVGTFLQSIVPDKYHPFLAYLGIALGCVGVFMILFNLPFVQQLAGRGWPKNLTIASIICFMVFGGWWWLNAEHQAKRQPDQQEKAAKTANETRSIVERESNTTSALPASEIEKRVYVLDSIHDVLTGEAREAYLFGHQLRNSWAGQIVNENPKFFALKVTGFRNRINNSLQSIDKILKQFSYYDDIDLQIRESWKFQGQFNESINQFLEGIRALPETPTMDMVLLLKPQGNAFSDAVDQYSAWIETTKEMLKNRRQRELSRLQTE